MKKLKFSILIFMVVVCSCQISPEPINYHQDECAFCKMKISDAKFGAEMVTKKGKIHKYDSAECLVRTYLKNTSTEYAFVLVTDYGSPRNLIDAETATFLISENQPSPMGGNLSAYADASLAEKVRAEKGGELLNFYALVENYKERYP